MTTDDPFVDAKNIDFFFSAPSTKPEEHRRGDKFSALYLLRRELLETQGYDPNVDAEEIAWKDGAKNRLFASLSLMFTGFDLLAKFEQGDGGKVGERYRAFLRSTEGGSLDSTTADLLWGVRNSILHAFGVPDDDMLKKMGLKEIAIAQRLVVETTLGAGSVSVRQNGEVAEVFIDGIYRVLLSAIDNYRDSLYGSGTEPAREQFNQMLAKYGTIRMI